MIAALNGPASQAPELFQVLLAPCVEAAGWFDQPPAALLCLMVLSGILLMMVPTPSPERDVA